MHVLTIFEDRRQIKVVETHEPPSEQMILAELAQVEGDAWFDVSRREFQPEDFDYREEEL